jgi:hypothetical protein
MMENHRGVERPSKQYIQPEKFGGTSKEDVAAWVDRFQRIVRHNRWTNDDLAMKVDVFFTEGAYKVSKQGIPKQVTGRTR